MNVSKHSYHQEKNHCSNKPHNLEYLEPMTDRLCGSTDKVKHSSFMGEQQQKPCHLIAKYSFLNTLIKLCGNFDCILANTPYTIYDNFNFAFTHYVLHITSQTCLPYKHVSTQT